jgi:predicted nucleic acid-binding protein
VSAFVVYDSMYLALALRVAGQMMTADERLVNSLAASPWAASVIRLQDVL